MSQDSAQTTEGMKGNFISGEFVEGSSSRPNINPSDTSDVIGYYAQADKMQVGSAIDAAANAFPTWATGNLQQRADCLERVGQELFARREELGQLLSREEGKTLPEGIAEVGRASQIFKFFAGEVVRQPGEHLDSIRSGVGVEITREPVGVVGIITPWNFPIAIPAWKIAPALAYGNAVVFKPAELVPASAWALADIISRAGFPEGVFNLVMGPGRVVGQTLVQDSRVSALTFTGSVETGRNLLRQAADTMKKVQLEMGGKNPLVVLDDADLDTAVTCAVQGAYFSTGQRCTASSRLIVQSGIHDTFVAAVKSRLAGLRVDHALAEGTDIGPVVDADQLGTDLRYIAAGAEEGAELVFGGEILERPTKGFYLNPALFVGATSSMKIAREEIFGPVACVIKVGSFEEALVVANDTEFGLSAGICTASLRYATHFKRHAQAGMVMVNVPTAGADYHVPFGGRKASSYGSREQGRYAVDFFTTVKTAYQAH